MRRLEAGFSANPRNFGELLGQYEARPVKVPPFQRGYSWEKGHVLSFLEDLLAFHSMRNPPTSYFLGPIVLLPEKSKVTLLDGQQRLATATIFFSVLRDLARESATDAGRDLARDIQRDLIQKGVDGKPALELSELDQPFFERRIQRDPPKEAKAVLRSHTLIEAAQEVLGEKIKGLLGNSSKKNVTFLRGLRDTLSTKIAMVAINVTSEDEAFTIFETLNDRGLRLAVPDLLLNFLMKECHSSNDRKLIRQYWDEMLEQIGRRDIDRFLRHFWLSQYGDVKARGLFREIKERLRTDELEPTDFAESCLEACELYVALLDHKIDVLGPATTNVEAVLKYLGAGSALPLLLSGLTCLSKGDFERLSDLATSMVLRHTVFGNLNPGELETAFFAAAREIRKCHAKHDSSAKCFHAAKDIMLKINPADDVVVAGAASAVLTRGRAQYIVTEIANSLQSATEEISVDKANLEHIFPLNPSQEWKQTDTLDPLRWNLGNLTILGTKLNQKAANSGYEKKKQIYAASEIFLSKDIPSKYKHWTSKELLERSKDLAKIVTKHWSI